ncbi:hypothetical protein JW766_00190 [Candidatus Dojkabacteria bacterium]|nr:hypothetical protein [Candidatus Dojkabacteria bacterium]
MSPETEPIIAPIQDQIAQAFETWPFSDNPGLSTSTLRVLACTLLYSPQHWGFSVLQENANQQTVSVSTKNAALSNQIRRTLICLTHNRGNTVQAGGMHPQPLHEIKFSITLAGQTKLLAIELYILRQLGRIANHIKVIWDFEHGWNLNNSQDTGLLSDTQVCAILKDVQQASSV